MIKFLEDVRTGVLHPRTFVCGEAARRSCSLQLSKNKTFENRFSGRVNWLDVDNKDERFVLSGTSDGSVCMFDMLNFVERHPCTAKILRNSRAHYNSVQCVQWYPFDSGLFITSGMDRRVKLWDTRRFMAVEEFPCDGAVYQHHMSSVNTKSYLIAVVGFGKDTKLIDVKSGSFTHELRGHTAVIRNCQWSPKEEYVLATGGDDSKIMLWDVRSSRGCLKSLDQDNGLGRSTDESCVAHDGQINSLKFTNDGLYLLSVGNDRKMILWNVFNGEREMVNYGLIKHNLKMQIAVTREARPTLVYVPTESLVKVFNMETGDVYNTLSGHVNMVTCCVYRPSYYQLITGSTDQTILVWCLEKEQTDELPLPVRIKDWSKILQKTYGKRLQNAGNDSE